MRDSVVGCFVGKLRLGTVRRTAVHVLYILVAGSNLATGARAEIGKDVSSV